MLDVHLMLKSLLLLTILIVIVWLWFKNRRRYDLLDKLPYSKGLPIIGNALDFILSNDPMGILTSISKKFNGICRVNIFIDELIVLSNTEYFETFYTSRNTDRADMYDPIKDVFYNSVFVANGNDWKEARKLFVTHFFHTPLEQLLDSFRKHSKLLLEELTLKADGTFFPLLEPLQKAATNALYEQAFGDVTPPEVMKIVTHDMEYLMKICFLRTISLTYMFNPIFRITPEGRRFYKAVRNVRESSENFIRMKKADFEKMTKRCETIPPLFVYNVLKNHPEKTCVEIASEMINLAPAAIDTSTQTTGFMLTMLALHPEIQEKIFLEDQEILKLLGDREPTADDMHLYECFDSVLKETLRLFPTAPIIGRKLSEDTYFGKYLIPAQTNVMAFQGFANHSEEYFKDPLKFDPDRFLPKNAANIPQYAYNPFSAGPRSCPGQKYTSLALNTAVLAIVRKFRVYSKYKSLKEALSNVTAELTLKDKYSFMVRLELRNA